jgi:predicted MFS family arabinose efflux permease
VAIGATFVLASALRTAVSPFVGRACDRRGVVAPTVAGLIITAGLMVVLPIPSSAAALVVLSVILLGGPLTTFLIPSASLITESAERAGIALAVATMLFNLAYAVGETVGAPAAAGLAQATSDTVPFMALAALMALTLRPVLAAHRRSAAAEPGWQLG